MAKRYTIKVWEDEVLLEDTVSPTTPTIIRYQVADDEGEVLIPSAQVRLINEVSNAGTPVDAAGMNNIEEGVDMLDTIVNQDGVTKIRESGGPTTLNIGAIAANMLLGRSGSSVVGVGAWTSYTPTFTNFTVGDAGTTIAEYVRFGNLVALRVHFQLGSTSVVSGAIELSVPINVVSPYQNTSFNAGLNDQNGPFYQGVAQFINSSTIRLRAIDVSGTYATIVDTSATVPFTWTTNDRFTVYAVYRVA